MKGGYILKKNILLFLSTLLFTNFIISTGNSTIIDSYNDHSKIINNIDQISPTALWFTEDETIL